MMLPFPDCPLKQQLGLGQVRVDCLLRFIHVCCQKTIRKSSLESCVARLLDSWRKSTTLP